MAYRKPKPWGLLKPPLGTQNNFSTSLSQGLIGAWFFNEFAGNKVYDISGNNHIGTFNGTPLWNTGQFGGAIKFNGSTDYIDTGSATLSDNLSAMSVSVIFKTSATSLNGYHIISKLVNFSTGAGWSLGNSGTGGNGKLIFIIQENGGNHWMEAQYTTGGNGFADGKWHQVLWTFSGVAFANSSFYIDGLLVSATNVSQGVVASFSNNVNLLIGADGGSGTDDKKFDGSIDMPIIWNRVLSPTEAQMNYINPFWMFSKPNSGLRQSANTPVVKTGNFFPFF